ncbi:hypothetical protein GS429_05750 [Natronorubrum sp. JWXQ-INN-674]|uniref:Uncharacterized protein n=1 Tax=Natronorubrum halalkaliphilum TaxID=2691917 RepID=A0A6B0VKP4_9EURY|nr:hypothetical protein [Natronorubrum halalkaliphilum]MXV61576.1 hypothetical protein [Natronorubrum halalkaliphilum]
MLRKLLIGFGCVEIVRPQPVIDMCERIGLENPDEAQLRPQALLGARLEGLIFVWLLVRGRTGSTVVSTLLGLAGIALVLLPQPIIELSQRLVYENTDELELKPWIEPAARALGGLYLLVVVLSKRSDEPDGAASAKSATSSESA